MAKQRTPFSGYFVGRLGTAVGAKLKGGEYVSRSYQPQVKNPNTLRQAAARDRFSVVSLVASKLAGVLEIGYAAASNGTKMYPRNMAIRDMYRLTNVIESDGRDIESIQWPQMPVSAQAGITVAPVGTYTAGTKTVTFTNTDDVELAADERLGVVVLVVTDEMETVSVLKAPATSGVVIPDSIAGGGMAFNVLAFYKVIKSSGTDIPADQWPWKYPSRTGASAFIWRQDV